MRATRFDWRRGGAWTGAMLATALIFFSVSLIAQGAPGLTIEPITWDVIGLDSNDQSDGPDTFPVGARVCSVGSDPAANLVATFHWDSPNGYIELIGPDTLQTDSLAVGSCHDFYFNVQIQRTADAIDTTRSYHISADADDSSTISTPVPRQLVVENLISQARNSIDAITGAGGLGDPAPTTVYVGQTYTYQLLGSTATNGYEQLETYLDFPNLIFQILSVDATYTAPSGASGDTVYADSCDWDPDPTSATYLECTGRGKTGGDIVLTYTVRILEAGSATVTGVIYDFSGNSFHYNSDHGVDTISITALEDADLAVTKADLADPVYTGESFEYDIEVTNNGPSDATNVVIVDTLPTGVGFQSASGDGWSCSEASAVVTCSRASLAAAETSTVTMSVSAPDGAGVIINQATVQSEQADTDPSNDSDDEDTTVLAVTTTTSTTIPTTTTTNEATTTTSTTTPTTTEVTTTTSTTTPTTSTTTPTTTTTTEVTTTTGPVPTTSTPSSTTTTTTGSTTTGGVVTSTTSAVGSGSVTTTTADGPLPFTGIAGPISQLTNAALLSLLLGLLLVTGATGGRD